MTPETLERGRAAYGLVQLGRSGVLAKLLGARLVLQAALTLLAAPAGDRSAQRALHELGAAVDALHAASMVGLAIWSSRRRREAIQQAVAAGAFVTAEVLVARAVR